MTTNKQIVVLLAIFVVAAFSLVACGRPASVDQDQRGEDPSKTTPVCPVVPSDGEFAFVDADGYPSMLRINEGKPSRLTEKTSLNCGPSWSPSGDVLAFLTLVDAGPRLVLLAQDGDRAELSVELPLPGFYDVSDLSYDIHWSPNGQYVAVEETSATAAPLPAPKIRQSWLCVYDARTGQLVLNQGTVGWTWSEGEDGIYAGSWASSPNGECSGVVWYSLRLDSVSESIIAARSGVFVLPVGLSTAEELVCLRVPEAGGQEVYVDSKGNEVNWLPQVVAAPSPPGETVKTISMRIDSGEWLVSVERGTGTRILYSGRGSNGEYLELVGGAYPTWRP
jgi:hypothetical protein